ncbi:MAG TPA: CHASE2 domain-containing protein [Rhodopila sp.]
MLRGKIVVIGVSATGIGQTIRTPLGEHESSPAIQAETIESILAGDVLWRPFWAKPAERAAGVLLGLAGGLLLGRVRHRTYLAAFAGASLLLPSVPVWAFRQQGLLLDWVFPSFCLGVCALAASTARVGVEVAAWRRHEAELAIERARRAVLKREVALRGEAGSLRQSLAFAVDAAQLGVWDADLLDGSWRHSARFDAILGLNTSPSGWSPDIVLNRVVPADRASAQRSLIEGKASGPLQLECGIRRSDGSIGYIHIHGRFWMDAEGVPNWVAGVVAEISTQRELELRLRQGEKNAGCGTVDRRRRPQFQQPADRRAGQSGAGLPRGRCGQSNRPLASQCHGSGAKERRHRAPASGFRTRAAVEPEAG